MRAHVRVMWQESSAGDMLWRHNHGRDGVCKAGQYTIVRGEGTGQVKGDSGFEAEQLGGKYYHHCGFQS